MSRASAPVAIRMAQLADDSKGSTSEIAATSSPSNRIESPQEDAIDDIVSEIVSGIVDASVAAAEDTPAPTKFETFPKLPLELRLIVWKFATPPPAAVRQMKSKVEGRQYHYDRAGGIPTVLHACVESRKEFLEIDMTTTEGKQSNEARRRNHPIYKLCFRNRSKKSEGCYMSPEIDTLWAAHTSPQRPSPNPLNIRTYSVYFGACKLPISSELKHLALIFDDEFLPKPYIDHIARFCPNLETITFLIKDYLYPNPNDISKQTIEQVYGPEREGRWGKMIGKTTGDNSPRSISSTATFYVAATMAPDMGKLQNPKGKYPAVNWRYEYQFMQVEGLKIIVRHRPTTVLPEPEAWSVERLRSRE